MSERLTAPALPSMLLPGQIVRAEALGQFREAQAVLAAARTEAARLLAAAAAEADRARAARLLEADRDARAAAGQMLADTSARAQRLLGGLPAELAGAIADATAAIIGELDRAEAVASAARRAMADLVERHGLVVQVARPQANRVRATLAGWGEAVQVVGDDGVADDACVIETRAGFVRAGLSEQLALLRQALEADADA